MQKTGKYRAIRNMPIGWILQAIHSTDRSERVFRIFIEILLFAIFYLFFLKVGVFSVSFVSLTILFIAVHSFVFLANGNFQVYLLDSFKWVKNPGIIGVLTYISTCKKHFCKFDSCDAILIYGSMCRNQLHIRSDLDLRIIRRTDSTLGFLALPIGYLLRAHSLFKWVPVDLQVVDSFQFLEKQMRADEKPIVVYCRHGVHIPNPGKDIKEVELNPESVLKVNNQSVQ